MFDRILNTPQLTYQKISKNLIVLFFCFVNASFFDHRKIRQEGTEKFVPWKKEEKGKRGCRCCGFRSRGDKRICGIERSRLYVWIVIRYSHKLFSETLLVKKDFRSNLFIAYQMLWRLLISCPEVLIKCFCCKVTAQLFYLFLLNVH